MSFTFDDITASINDSQVTQDFYYNDDLYITFSLKDRREDERYRSTILVGKILQTWMKQDESPPDKKANEQLRIS